jgi:L-ascorbate metabolism protein UlaG (beta-lactamase superfamily)
MFDSFHLRQNFKIMAKLRFLGVAAYEIINNRGQRILMDPYIDSSPGCPVKSAEFDKVDLIIVSHAPFDHFGDTEEIARRTGAPVVCGGEIRNYLIAKGIPSNQIRATVWGICVVINGIKVYPVENHHWSQMKMPDGSFASGVPNAYVIYLEDGIRFYHYGDTAIFGDLKLIRDIHRPTHGCLGITNPTELLAMSDAPGKIVTGEMNPLEGALAAEWLGLETVFPCHYYDAGCADVLEFNQRLEVARKQGKQVAKSVALQPGDWYELAPVPGWVPLYE